MRYQIIILALAILSTEIQAVDLFAQTAWPIEKAYIPTGFDDNDNVQIVVNGEFPNSCFQPGAYSTEVDQRSNTIYIEQKAHALWSTCLQYILPFTQVIDVGVIGAGVYRVVDATTGDTIGQTSIARAMKPTQDDDLYPIVDEAKIRRSAGKPEMNEIELEMHFKDRCSRLGRVEVNYYDDVIVVRPIVAPLYANWGTARCTPAPEDFVFSVPVKEGVKGTYLLHVRSMNGQALNRMVEIN